MLNIKNKCNELADRQTVSHNEEGINARKNLKGFETQNSESANIWYRALQSIKRTKPLKFLLRLILLLSAHPNKRKRFWCKPFSDKTSPTYRERLNTMERDQFWGLRFSFLESLEQYMINAGKDADDKYIKKIERLIFDSKNMDEFRDNL